MLTLELDPRLEELFAELARKTHRSPGELAQELAMRQQPGGFGEGPHHREPLARRR